MTIDPRTPVFDAVRKIAPPGVFNDPGNIHALSNLLDALGAAREGSVHAIHAPSAFFAAVRQITGPLDQIQVETVNDLLAAASHWPIGWLAYGLATAWHEARLKPIAEYGKGKGRPYAAAGKYGQPQYGRGLCQITWDRNYEWADKALGLNGSLLANFDRALEPAIATAILVKGMEIGAFTGKSLADFIGDRGTPASFLSARKIINGTDRDALIATYAEAFQKALDEGKYA